ncbi:hypothetical protein [Parasphingorhabdus sp.]|uniref:hypothetical protein n=1 Tax=Parasphingorhabdus sp. TaxID=2709688 RepID=UPI0032989804
MVKASNQPSKAQVLVDDPSCSSTISEQKTRDSLKSAIVAAVSFNRDSYADRPDFFTKNRVLVGLAELRPNHSDVIAYVSGQNYCGTGGCKGFIFKDKSMGSARPEYSLIARIRPARLPIVSLKTFKNGWAEMGVAVAGGGISKPHIGTLSFDGVSFDSNPTLSNARHISEDEIKSVIIGEPGEASRQCRLS